mmetsp:Transcript_37201/g.80910  ORF Transcript_37201/g.80910 Transcript_37201/m.80910 type:complete len:122 (-) Transcript_37201:133-498(-)
MRPSASFAFCWISAGLGVPGAPAIAPSESWAKLRRNADEAAAAAASAAETFNLGVEEAAATASPPLPPAALPRALALALEAEAATPPAAAAATALAARNCLASLECQLAKKMAHGKISAVA